MSDFSRCSSRKIFSIFARTKKERSTLSQYKKIYSKIFKKFSGNITPLSLLSNNVLIFYEKNIIIFLLWICNEAKTAPRVKFTHRIENVWIRNYAVKISLWKFKPLKRVPQTKPPQDAQSSWKFKMVGIFSFFVKTKDWLYQGVFSQLLLKNTLCFDLPLLIRRYFCFFLLTC